MRLYLSSHQCGNSFDQLFGLLGTRNPRTVVITNASDFHDSPLLRNQSTQNELTRLENHGITAHELDLRKYFADSRGLSHILHDADLIWVRGGNTFLLRKALYISGADKMITDLLDRDKVVYGGHSAGVAVLGPSLSGIELVDNQHVSPPSYNSYPLDDAISTSGLGIVPYQIAPHYRSSFIDSIHVDTLVEYYKHTQKNYITLRDGEALIVNNNKEYIVGKPER